MYILYDILTSIFLGIAIGLFSEFFLKEFLDKLFNYAPSISPEDNSKIIIILDYCIVIFIILYYQMTMTKNCNVIV